MPNIFNPAALFITFREAVEGGVVVAVALAFLRKTGMEQYRPHGAPRGGRAGRGVA